jgi:hypothetical protein
VDAADVGARLRRVPPLAVDALLAAAVAVAIGFAIAAEQEVGAKEPDALAYAFGVAELHVVTRLGAAAPREVTTHGG